MTTKRSLLVATVALSLVHCSLRAQVKPLKEDLLKLLDLLPAACASLDDAKAKCGDMGGNGCKVDKLMAPFQQAFEAKSTERVSAGNGMNASQEAMMKRMQDPAFQEEMKKMTPQQLMDLSTQLQSGGLPTSGSPSAEETAMAEEFSRINEDVMDFAMKYNTEWAQLEQTFEEKKRGIEQARGDELKKCPKETSGEMTFTSPKCCAEVEKKYDAMWRTATGEWLPKANDIVQRYRAAVKQRYTEAEKRLAALAYGDKCRIQMFYDMVTGTQTQMLSSIEAVATMGGETCRIACENAVGADQEMICP